MKTHEFLIAIALAAALLYLPVRIAEGVAKAAPAVWDWLSESAEPKPQIIHIIVLKSH